MIAGLYARVRRIGSRAQIIVDTDIGDDIDDAFAIAWALASNRARLRAILTAHGDTERRARLVGRMLRSFGRKGVQVLTGLQTETDVPFTQAAWAEGEAAAAGDGVAAALDLIRTNPGRMTLVALAPLHNVEAMIRRDVGTFRRLRRVIVMGGSIRRGYNSLAGEPNSTPQVEHNIRLNPSAFRQLVESGVPVTVMPLDAVQARPSDAFVDTVTRAHPCLGELLELWRRNNSFNVSKPTLFDVVAMAAVLAPDSCRSVPMRISVDAVGMTTEVAGDPNVSVCLEADHERILREVARDLQPSRESLASSVQSYAE